MIEKIENFPEAGGGGEGVVCFTGYFYEDCGSIYTGSYVIAAWVAKVVGIQIQLFIDMTIYFRLSNHHQKCPPIFCYQYLFY